MNETEYRLQRIKEAVRRCSCKGRFCDAWGCDTVLFLIEEIRRLQREKP